MPRGKTKQLSILDEANDPQIAKIADRVVEIQKEYKEQKDRFDAQSKNLLWVMGRLGKTKIKDVLISNRTMSEHAMMLERRFNICIPPDEFFMLKTYEELVNYLSGKGVSA